MTNRLINIGIAAAVSVASVATFTGTDVGYQGGVIFWLALATFTLLDIESRGRKP